MLNGKNKGTFKPTGRLIAFGLAGNDRISVTGKTSRAVEFRGDAGNDVLTGSAGNDILLGGAGNNTLTDSAGNNVLVGGVGNDALTGGSGRDILIGGAGKDKLTGGANDDIFIGASTAWDNNCVSLTSLMAEWSRKTIAYATRISHPAQWDRQQRAYDACRQFHYRRCSCRYVDRRKWNRLVYCPVLQTNLWIVTPKARH